MVNLHGCLSVGVSVGLSLFFCVCLEYSQLSLYDGHLVLVLSLPFFSRFNVTKTHYKTDTSQDGQLQLVPAVSVLEGVECTKLPRCKLGLPVACL